MTATGPEPVRPGGTVLIVDDDPVSLQFLADALASLPDVQVRTFSHGTALLEAARAERPDLIITDMQMPEVDGLAILQAFAATEYLPPVPIIVVTGSDNRDVRRRALQLGASDFLTKPLDPDEIRVRCRNLVNLTRAQRALSDRAAWLAAEVRRATGTVVAREHETIFRLARAAEYRDWETGTHIRRIAEYCRLIAERLGLPASLQEDLYLAAPLHDLGKLGIPDYILRKPSRLSPEEYAVMQRHTVIGHELLHDSPSHLLHLGAEIALTHHERFDGTGYPQGLAGSAIPLVGRIVAVADVFDALISSRPYKACWPREEARALVLRGAGSEFDPDCVDAFMAEWDPILVAAERWSDEAQLGARTDTAAAL
ncbi:MAG: response regulator [Gemmatimonadota bacterium]|nr:response regulator [Gemmatimonadota bacterium]